MAELPSGTVTFLFTDIERSTESAAALGDEKWALALQTHRDLLRPCFEKHNGVEVGTEGDSFFVAFARAGDAVQAAVDGMSAIESHAWGGETRLRVRMGIHTGEVLVREGGYVGHEVHRAKRISDAAHGGQILISRTTADLIGSGLELRDLGPHRLKDLGESQRLFQLLDDGLQADFPALRSLEAFRHNLPLQRSAFVGREREIAELRELLDEHRLVTLTGVGGCGKTRLALQVGAELLDLHSDGVFFIDLARISDPEAIWGAVASALGIAVTVELGTAAPGGRPQELVLGYLSQRRSVLIFDNCEHLLDPCAEIVDEILAKAPTVRLLATSREALDVEGEHAWRIPSLSLPADISEAQTSEAVTLFKVRAKAARGSFDLTPLNLEAVVDICRRLDGIPLAIEFASARVAHMSPQEISGRLGDMFRLLTGGRRRVQRQQTLQAALDWSYELLSPAEQILLRRLAVFAGSFTLEAVEGVCSGEDVGSREVLDLIGSLVAKSLVLIEEPEPDLPQWQRSSRYRLIETVRLYSSERLREAGEADAFRARHRDWFQTLIESMDWLTATSIQHSGPIWFMEQANLRAALEWSQAEGRSDLVARMASRLVGLWVGMGNIEEGYRWLTLSRPEDLEIDAGTRTATLMLSSGLASFLGLPDFLELADRAVGAGRDEPSVPLLRALHGRSRGRAVLSEWLRDEEMAAAARRDLDEADKIGKALGLEGLGYSNRAVVEMVLGNIEGARESAALAVPLSIEPFDASTLAAAAHILGDHDQASAAARASLEGGIHSEFVAAGWAGLVITPAAVAIAGAGALEEARSMLIDYLEDTRRSRRPSSMEELFVGLAAVAHMSGRHVEASKLLAWVRARTFDAGRIIPSNTGYALYQHYVHLVRQALAPEEARRCVAEGRAMSEDEAVVLAHTIADG